jgi:geranylgeranyl diphosphate synthase type II
MAAETGQRVAAEGARGMPAEQTDRVPAAGEAAYPEHLRAEVDRYLEGLRFSEEAVTSGLEEAMRYSLLAGGKRIRPVLALATARALGIDHAAMLPFAGAVELIHTYSLIHDDLPAMDDDELRRGRPTCHRVYGEDVAILAGDALYAEAFRHLLTAQQSPPEQLLAAAAELALATGVNGMVGGQYLDIHRGALSGEEAGAGAAAGSLGARAQEAASGAAARGAHPGEGAVSELRRVHELKTGRLIGASVSCVLLLAAAPERARIPFRRFAAELGVLFQIVDDILDVTGTDAALGKPRGSDERHGRHTYVSELGIEGARALAAESHRAARDALTGALAACARGAAGRPGAQQRGAELIQITDLIFTRTS